jgi:hypothetical protein
MIKSGEVAVVKSTGERCFVLSIDGDVATVKRPTATQANGIVHQTETFTVAELETPLENMIAEGDIMFQYQEAIQKKRAPEPLVKLDVN